MAKILGAALLAIIGLWLAATLTPDRDYSKEHAVMEEYFHRFSVPPAYCAEIPKDKCPIDP